MQKTIGPYNYSIENEILTISAKQFSMHFRGYTAAEASWVTDAPLSLPYVAITAHGWNAKNLFCLWEDLPLVYISALAENDRDLLTLKGDHWTVRNIRLRPFTDDSDTLTTENQWHMLAHTLYDPLASQNHGELLPLSGDMFFLENPADQSAVVIISEAPDYCTTTLCIDRGTVRVENGGNGLAVGFCKRGECEAFARSYYRHARKPQPLVTMSNTWGDFHSRDHVCDSFIRREIDAAAEIGVDIVQIDDGWQTGYRMERTYNAAGKRTYHDPFWELAEERFPDGMKVIGDYAAARGIRIGLWFAPDTDNGYERLQRDKAVLRRAYHEWGARFFKLDYYWITERSHLNGFMELLREIHAFGDDVSVQLDTTRDARLNYLCGRQYGTIFVENRYSRTATAFPHRVLRNLWMISKYVPAAKFQFEILNPDLNADSYEDTDPFRPQLYEMDYLFATVMLANPLFWMEMQFLSEERRAELARILPVWKEHRGTLSAADVMPIGEKPSGASFPGFLVCADGAARYLVLFRENTDRPETVIPAPVRAAEATVLASNADVSIAVEDGFIRARFTKEHAYAFVQIG